MLKKKDGKIIIQQGWDPTKKDFNEEEISPSSRIIFEYGGGRIMGGFRCVVHFREEGDRLVLEVNGDSCIHIEPRAANCVYVLGEN